MAEHWGKGGHKKVLDIEGQIKDVGERHISQ
jgi:hypothetical protein